MSHKDGRTGNPQFPAGKEGKRGRKHTAHADTAFGHGIEQRYRVQGKEGPQGQRIKMECRLFVGKVVHVRADDHAWLFPLRRKGPDDRAELPSCRLQRRRCT